MSGEPRVTVSPDSVVELVRRWLSRAASEPTDSSAALLAGLLREPEGLDFTVGFIDTVIRPEDSRIAARNFAVLAKKTPTFLPWHVRAAMKLGAQAARVFPGLVMPLVTSVLRHMLGHLVVDARPEKLTTTLARLRTEGTRLNVNLLGEAVLGRNEAQRRLAGTIELLERPDVDYVSIKVSATVPPHNPWGFDAAVTEIVAALTPLYRRAVAASPAKFVNLDMEEYHDLDLTIAVFTALLDSPEFEHLEAGIVLQSYLPDALGAMQRLQEWSAARYQRTGAAIKVRVVKGANLPLERVDADLHGWLLATWSSKLETDASYKSVINWALTPERIPHVRIGVAGHNLFDLAWTWLLAGNRGVREGIDFEMLLGMAPAQAAAVRADVGELLLYTPVVYPGEFDVAIAYLIRRLEEGASADNFMSAVFDLAHDEDLFAREERRFRQSLGRMFVTAPAPRRQQDRRAEPTPDTGSDAVTVFTNATDTDPSLPGNRLWAAAIGTRIPTSTLGSNLAKATTITTSHALEAEFAAALGGATPWARLGADARATILLRVANVLESRRHELLEVMASECGKTLDQGDPEVSEAIDFARYYAAQARNLESVDGATFVPVSLTAVVPPWNFPIAIPAGSTLAALATGSAVLLKPAPQARRCGAVLAQALWDAGVPRDVLRLVNVDEDHLGRSFIADPRIERLILTGSYDTAKLFRTFRFDLPILAETSGKNAIVVTPSADINLAVKDVVTSAFGHAGQKCSAASLVILVGSAAKSRRFTRQLVDAVTSLPVGLPTDPLAKMGPLVQAPTGKLLAGLTQLGPGEKWLVTPRQLTDTLWTPGVRTGVKPGSAFHLTEYFGPVVGIMTARNLDEALRLQNAVEYGLTAGLHSLDEAEIATWIDRVEAGNLYVNRGTTGAIVQRQPFGGWKKSAAGPGAKSGGPNYLTTLGSWRSAPADATGHPSPDILGFVDRLVEEFALAGEDAAFLHRSVFSDAAAWRDEFGVTRDVGGLWSERNEFRYRSVPVHLHLGPAASPAEVLRVLVAAKVAGSVLTYAGHASAALAGLLEAEGVTRVDASQPGARVRLIGGDPQSLMADLDGSVDVAIWGGPVTEAGRIELLPFLREQAISITAHRFGTPLFVDRTPQRTGERG